MSCPVDPMAPAVPYHLENRAFFENAPADWLPRLLETKGLHGNADLEAVKSELAPQLQDSTHVVLEVGFGFGRVLRWLRAQNPTKRILGLDHCQRFYEEQARAFAADAAVELWNVSATDVELSETVDLVLWMWAGFCELDDGDKRRALDRIVPHLVRGGKFVVEFPEAILGHEQVDIHADGSLIVQTDFGNLNCFQLGVSELAAMTAERGLKLTGNRPYSTLAGIPRRILVFEKE